MREEHVPKSALEAAHQASVDKILDDLVAEMKKCPWGAPTCSATQARRILAGLSNRYHALGFALAISKELEAELLAKEIREP